MDTIYKKITMQLKEYENIKLYHGDCMDLMRETPDKYYDIAIVDPPYGEMCNLNGGRKFNKMYKNSRKEWNNKIPTIEYFNELFRVAKNQIIFGANYFELPPCREFICWDKKQPEGVSFSMVEFAWTSFNKGAKIYRKSSANLNRIHPTQKPIDLYDWIIKNYVNQGDKILDTHLGSGSIVISVDKANSINNMNLQFTGIELDEDYYNDMIKRFENYKSQLTLTLT